MRIGRLWVRVGLTGAGMNDSPNPAGEESAFLGLRGLDLRVMVELVIGGKIQNSSVEPNISW